MRQKPNSPSLIAWILYLISISLCLGVSAARAEIPAATRQLMLQGSVKIKPCLKEDGEKMFFCMTAVDLQFSKEIDAVRGTPKFRDAIVKEIGMTMTSTMIIDDVYKCSADLSMGIRPKRVCEIDMSDRIETILKGLYVLDITSDDAAEYVHKDRGYFEMLKAFYKNR